MPRTDDRRATPHRAGPVAPGRALWIVLAAIFGFGCADAPPNLLLVTLDTTRPDHLSVYGYEHKTTPTLESLADEGRVYERVYSVTNWTLAAHASLFTGRFPRSHGATYDPEGDLALGDAISGKARYAAYTARRLPEEQATLAEHLAERGYATAAVVAGPWMKRMFGLDQGFESYDDRGIAEMAGRLAGDVSDAAIAWLEERDARRDARPFFLFLNYYDPHGPYGDPKGYAARFSSAATTARTQEAALHAQLSALYDGEIFYADEQLGRVVDWLRERDRLDDTLVVVTADHGELLGEHGGVGHGSSMYEEELRIPLVVKPPARSAPEGPERIDEPVQILDVPALALAELGVEPMAGVQGGLPPEIGHPLFAETRLPIDDGQFAWRVLYSPPHKLHWSPKGAHRLFDLERDPGEAREMARARPAIRRQLEHQLRAFEKSLPEPEGDAVPLDDETRRLLESLGYLEAQTTDAGE